MPEKNHLIIATRNSPLALAQTERVKQALIHLHPQLTIEILPMVTEGDKFLASPLYSIGGKALFLKELEQALLNHQADIAVHSLKDMPTDLPEGLHIGAICRRDNPYDILAFKQQDRATDLALLAQNAVIGTSSLRRKAQLLAYRPDLKIKDIRGNINSRLKKLNQQDYDALILAAAGLERLDIRQHQIMPLPANIMLPAPGQGAIAIEHRTDDQQSAALIEPLNHTKTMLCVKAERIIQSSLGAGCQTPLAAYAQIDQHDHINIEALIASEDGQTIIRAETYGEAAQYETLSQQLAAQLISMGADKLISRIISK